MIKKYLAPGMLATAMLTIATPALHAESDAEASRTPGDLTNEDRVAMVRYVNDYGRCLREKSAELLRADSDVRVVIDTAAQGCEEHMDALKADLAERRVDPDFAANFAERMQNRTLRRLLPELMAGQASR